MMKVGIIIDRSWMEHRSHQIAVRLPNERGEQTTYYTYDGYLEEDARRNIRNSRRNYEHFVVSASYLAAFVGFVATRRLPLPSLAIRNWNVPAGGVFSSAVAGVGGWLLASGFSSLRVKSITEGEVLNGAHVPLWSNARLAVNPDRAYFELADERNNEPLIFHSGLTPEAASKLIPDKIIGSVPAKPHQPEAHPHH